MNDQYWSWILGLVGLVGFWLAGKKVWWCWYVNIANQVLWTAYSLITDQLGFLVATAFYFWVFSKNAYSWTKEHFESKKPNPENYCMGRTDGDNWISPSCQITLYPHEPHEIAEEDRGWDFNTYRFPPVADVKVYDTDEVIPPYVKPEAVLHPLVPKYEPIPEPPKQTPEVMCTGRPRHDLCEMPIVGHMPHMIRIPNPPKE